MKKLVSLLLAVAMLLACASALAEIPEGFHAEGMPIVDEPITISVLTMRWGSMGDSFKTNPFLVNLEKESNVKVNWQIVSSNDWADNQKPVMLAGGESALPEVVLGFQTFSESDIINNVEYFLPLEDLIEQYMPNLTKAFEEMPALKAISTSADGHIYSLPSRMPKRPVACNVPVINVKWLENLGLEVPTTIDELENVLRAFKEQDANGNGDPNDEIPFTGIGLGMDFLSPFGMTDVYGQRYQQGDLNGLYSLKSNQLSITTVCKHPEVVLRWADQFYTGEASIQNFWGGLGEVTTANADGTYTLNNPPEGTSADAWYWDRSLRDFGPKYCSIEFDKKIILDPTEGDGLKVAMDAETAQYVRPCFPELKYTADEYNELSFLQADIDTYVDTTRARWVAKGGIDEEWDAYVEQLKNMGLEDMNKIYEGAYARYLAAQD